MEKHLSWSNESVWQRDWPHQVHVGQWPIFYRQAILFHILKTIWWRNIVFGVMDQCDIKIDLVKYMWVSDLYIMDHWFCLIFYDRLKPEDHWSCTAHLSAEIMLKPAVIEKKKFKHSPWAKIIMSTGRPHHYGHLLQVYKESLQPLIYTLLFMI